jgi:hypothetical protein
VAGALPCFVFQLFAELKSFQNGPCATQFYTFGRRPQPPLRQGDSLATPCSCKIWAPARPKHKGSPCAELRHDPTEHRLSTRKQGSQHGLTIHNPGNKEEGQAWLCLPTTPIPQTQAWPSLAQRLSTRRATARSDRAPALYTHLLFPSLSLSRHSTASEHTHGNPPECTHTAQSPQLDGEL